jgi:hypothetical protein
MRNLDSYFRLLILPYANVFPRPKNKAKKLHSECLSISKSSVSWLLPMFTLLNTGGLKGNTNA